MNNLESFYHYLFYSIITTVSSNLIKTGEFLAPTPQPPPPPSQATTLEEDSYTTIPLNFSKVLQSTSIVEMHKLLRSCVELRVVENKIVLNNEPKPDDLTMSISSTKDALKGYHLFYSPVEFLKS